MSRPKPTGAPTATNPAAKPTPMATSTTIEDDAAAVLLVLTALATRTALATSTLESTAVAPRSVRGPAPTSWVAGDHAWWASGLPR